MYRKAERQAYRSMGNGYYHFCTDGWKGGCIFNNADQYAFGMVLMGLICIKFNVVIYAFVLMPNHIHIILKGTGSECVQAFDYLKRKLSAMLRRCGYPTLPEGYWFNLNAITDPDQMRTEIIYVLRNPLEKGLGTASGYPWGSGWCYHSLLPEVMGGIPVSRMSVRHRTRYFTTEDPVPGDWKVHPYLGLLPDSFVDTSFVLKLFQTPKDLQIALVKDYEAYYQISRRLGDLCEFNKAEMTSIVSQTLQKRFDSRGLGSLSEEEKGRLAIILSREFGFTSYQISTSIFIKEKVVRQLLASKELR